MECRREHSTERAEDTAAVATGLGISFDNPPNTPRLRRPRSFDSDSLAMRDPKPVHDGLAATAPLPSNESFQMLSPDASPAKSDTEREQHEEDLESGKHEMRECANSLQDQQQPESGGIAGVLESVNALIDFVAGDLARMASDRVDYSAERRLLLPVRKKEREPAVVVL